MQLVVDIQSESLMTKIIQLLNVFSSDGVKVKVLDSTKGQKTSELTDEFIEKNWKKIGMNTHSVSLDDDERIYEAAAEFYSDKHSS